MEGPASKLFQRKLYSWLSSRRGVPLCVLGLLTLAISAFQFGEVLLEWSKERYAAQFSIYHDNIAGRSFETYMTPELPIDIVYTWVNGSDPLLLAELRILKQQLAALEEKNKKKEAVQKNSTNVTTNAPTPTINQCPFKHCVPWRTLIVDATNLSSELTLSSLTDMFPTLKPHALDVMYLNASGKHITPAYAVRMESEEKVSSYLEKPFITSSNGANVSLTRGFLSSDAALVGGVPLIHFVMITSPHLFPGNSTIRQLLVATLNNLNIGLMSEVEIGIRGVGVASFSTEIDWQRAWSNNVTFLNDSMSCHLAFAVWLPFKSHGEAEPSNDIISQNRFQDNEELRYSLRSVEQFAPWIRHIYIVTNGQIPHWLNLDNPRISIVTHQDIYLNKSHLPSYSSPSIESHLHRIPGLSKWFLYLNDDVMFGQEVWPHDFFTPDGGQKIYLSWAVPNCADGCPSNWINDKYCDSACNVSSCDWDGGDCINATKPGPVGQRAHSWSSSQRNVEYCSTGCLNTWVGDRYCDNACNVFTCGYDAGDCGTEKFTELYSISISPHTPANSTFIVPLETSSMFINLTAVFSNKTISGATYTASPVVRTAIVAQKYKLLCLTFANNVSQNSSNFTITSKSEGKTITIQFSIVADTATKNASLPHSSEGAMNRWSFPHYNDTNAPKFIDELSVKIMDHDSLIVSWLTEKPTMSSLMTPPISSTLTNYTVANTSVLPLSIAKSLEELQTELKDGDLTEKGFLKKTAALLRPYNHLPGVYYSTVQFDVTKNNDTPAIISNTGHPSHARNELSHKETGRKLLSATDFPSSWLPWERYGVFPVVDDAHYATPTHKGRRLLDTFADSLRYVNMLYTREYGHHSRKVPAHMPHMINKVVMEELQKKYARQFDITSSHKLRHNRDMQFAFSYFYYIIGEKTSVPLSDVFQKLDTDKSGILSVRELRTLLVRIMELPLTAAKITEFEDMLRQCGQQYNHSTLPSIDPLEFETHYDPDLPLVTLEFLGNCTELVKKINKTSGLKNKYKYSETNEDQVQFKMLVQNSSKVLTRLDEVRKDQRKFICLNDNLDHTKEDSRLAALILQDFYEALFPIPSQFELAPNYRNKFLYVKDLEKWLEGRWIMQTVLQTVCLCLILICLISLFYGKIVQFKRRALRYISSCFSSNSRPRRVSTV